jgi:phospholipid N-methyltransferase
MGAILPSSKYLSRLMVSSAEVQDDHVIVELGAGTGPVTGAIRRAVPNAPVLALEPGEELVEHLRQTYPDVDVSGTYVQDLVETAGDWGHSQVDSVISSLPWTVFPEEAAKAGLAAVAEILKPDGIMVTFTYVHANALLPGGKRLRQLLNAHFNDVSTSRIEWRNAPPALVYICREPKKSAP